MKIIEDLYRTNRVFCSPDYDRCVEYLAERLPFEVRRFGFRERPLRGWAIPPEWDVTEVYIARDGEILYDGTWHPLAVIALSALFEGTVSRGTLRKHLHTVDPAHQNPEAVPFHFRQSYRPWDRDWGFCVPCPFYEELEPREYEVGIRTEEDKGYLDALSDAEEQQMLGSFRLEMPGSSTPLVPQHSVEEDAMVDRALEAGLQQVDIDYRTGSFRSIIGTDEIVWGATTF